MRTPSPEQRLASDPGRSVWVNANAGSGKTTVLVNRVVRLMLSGADPARILCLTFTKAAAANMQDRIFRDLGLWAAMPDAELAAAIAAMTGESPNAAGLAVARQLFARAVETPGGLKIQTIHAFCERLLHLFPFEADIPARFELLDEAQAAAAMHRATTGALRQALGDDGGPLAAALATATAAAGEDGVRETLKTFVKLRRDLPDVAPERKFALSPVRAALGVAAGATAEGLKRELFDNGIFGRNWREIADWLAAGSANDVKAAARIRNAAQSRLVEDYASIHFTEKGEARKSFATEKSAKARADLVANLEDDRDHFSVNRDRYLAALAAERSEAMALLADETLRRYRAEKRRLGRLDFADLIDRTRALLTSDASRWVLWKLDQGVDHVLVDEAQDTSPEQWDIVKALTDDFFAGSGARGRLVRTVFAVGDEKQSIFGFQGARPEAFGAAKRHFERRIATHNIEAERKHAFEPVPLLVSYRSTLDIMSAVDQVFSLPENFAGLQAEARRTEHGTNRTGKPGLVELWPPEPPPPKQEDDPDAPLDARPPDAATKRLATRIARRIRWWIDTGARLDATGRRIGAGDVLILVRNRGPVFEDVIKALKDHKVPVAGADRMRLTEQIAVMDLLSLGRFCLNAEDDLSLAEVLKSPLIGFDDAMLEAVAAGRGAVSLWAALHARAADDAACRDAAAILARWRGMAGSLDPFRFYATLLGPERMRRRLIQRLGPDAAEAIDVFLARLRQWQSSNPPSLLLFLEAMAGDDSDVKRDMEDAHGRVRVMTVHGSKGLEAPIVFLADIFRGAGNAKDRTILIAAAGNPETAVWVPRKDDRPSALQPAIQRREAEDAAEHRRLLYVAMTRAEDRLYIAGAEPGRMPADHWRGLIEAALGGHEGLITVPDEAGDGEVRQWRKPADPPSAPTDDAAEEAALPFEWLDEQAASDLPRPPPIRPSRLADAAEPPPIREALTLRSEKRLAGELTHLLFQHLPDIPPARRADVGAKLAAARFGGLDEDTRRKAIAATLAILSDPRWAGLFGHEARTEVEIAGIVTAGGKSFEVAGRIDRLMIAPDRVTVLDYKTGRPPRNLGDPSESHLRQLAAYRALARDLYPDRRIETAILWTEIPAIAAIDDAALDAAMGRID